MDPEFEEPEELDDDRDDEVDDHYSHSCDFPLYELPAGEENRNQI